MIGSDMRYRKPCSSVLGQQLGEDGTKSRAACTARQLSGKSINLKQKRHRSSNDTLDKAINRMKGKLLFSDGEHMPIPVQWGRRQGKRGMQAIELETFPSIRQILMSPHSFLWGMHLLL
jgi:hypothetical protein